MTANDRHEEGHGMIIAGMIVLGVGVLFLLEELDIIPNFRIVWPVFPIIVGAALIVGGLMRRRGAETPRP